MKSVRGRFYAVAVRRQDGLFLLLRIRRAPSGIFLVFPIAGARDINFHASYHKDGRFHYKDFDRKSFSRRLAKPDSTFHGGENLVTQSIGPEQWRNLKTPCRTDEFFEVFEIPLDELMIVEHSWTHAAVDVPEPVAIELYEKMCP